jgi:acid phosphatase
MRQSRREFVRTLFIATQAAALAPLWPGKLFAADAQKGGLNFLVFGDWGRNGDDEQRAVAKQMGVAAQGIGAKFVISVGDNFYENGIASVNDLQWQTSFEKVYTAPSLQVPWRVILGNHDYRGNCDAQIEYSKQSPRWNMPARYFKCTEPIDADHAVDFFYLDTTPMATFTDDIHVSKEELKKQTLSEQITWLETSLAASTAPWKIVVAHHPVYSGGIHGDTPYVIKHVLPLLEKYGVQAYFNGHDHDLQHLQAGKINLFCSGAGSKVRETKDTKHTKFAKGSTPGFVTAALSVDELVVRMIDGEGQMLYTTTIPRKAS